MSESLNAQPEGWVLTSIDQIFDIFSGYGFPKNLQGQIGKEIGFFKVGDISISWNSDARYLLAPQHTISLDEAKEIRAKPFPKNTLVFAKIGEAVRLNRRALLSEESLLDNNVMGVWCKEEFVDPIFTYWFSVLTPFDMGARASVIPSMRKSDVGNIVFTLPPRKEQARIVEKLEELLSDLDNGVAELKAAQTKLSQYRQSLLKSAVEGSLTAEWRKQNPVTETGEQLLQRILTERRQRWEQQKLAEFKEKGKTPPKDWQKKYPEPVQPDTSELPKLPEGWVWASLGQCFRVEVGATPSRKQPSYWEGNIPWASSGEVQFERVSDTREKITEEGLNNSSTNVNPKGSVLLGMIGEGKTRGQVAILDIDAANNQNCAALWVPETEISSEFVFFWLWSRYEETRHGSSGNNQPALNKSLVQKMPIAISSISELKEIGNLLITAFEQSDAKDKEISKSLLLIEAQRKNILKAAFSGQLVPQDPNDEPASALLDKIKAERAKQNKKQPTRRKKKAAVA